MKPHLIAQPAEHIGHAPTAALITALASADWRTTTLEDHGPAGIAAVAYHPDAPDVVTVTMSLEDTSRVASVQIAGRDVPFRRAVEYVYSTATDRER